MSTETRKQPGAALDSLERGRHGLESLIPPGEQVTSVVASMVNGGPGLACVSAGGIFLWDEPTDASAFLRWDEVQSFTPGTRVVHTVAGDDIHLKAPVDLRLNVPPSGELDIRSTDDLSAAADTEPVDSDITVIDGEPTDERTTRFDGPAPLDARTDADRSNGSSRDGSSRDGSSRRRSTSKKGSSGSRSTGTTSTRRRRSKQRKGRRGLNVQLGDVGSKIIMACLVLVILAAVVLAIVGT